MSKVKANQSIDHRRLALKKACLTGQIDQCSLQDLKTVVSTRKDVVKYQLRFEYVRSLCVIEGQLDTVLDLLCLRCLQPVSCPLECAIKLVILEDESKLALVPEGYDAWILENKVLTMESLLAEELLLSMPLDVRHDELCDGVCAEKEQIKKLLV